MCGFYKHKLYRSRDMRPTDTAFVGGHSVYTLYKLLRATQSKQFSREQEFRFLVFAPAYYYAYCIKLTPHTTARRSIRMRMANRCAIFASTLRSALSNCNVCCVEWRILHAASRIASCTKDLLLEYRMTRFKCLLG